MPKYSSREFARYWDESGGSPARLAEILKLDKTNIYKARRRAEKELGRPLLASSPHSPDANVVSYSYNPRVTIDGFTGRMVVFSDAHWWPGISDTLAYRALIETIKEYKPKLIIANGDILDGAKVSRFPPDGWDKRPRMADELDEVKSRMSEIRHAYRGAQHIRTIGNHDTRFDRYLAVNAGEFEGIKGFRLSDHLSEWKECIATFINGHTVVKHRFNGGIHAAYSNTLRAGTNIFTGHTHRLGVTAWGDYNGRRYGCETGSLAQIDGPQFAYAEQNPSAGCSGFSVGTFDSTGRLLYPELAEVVGDACWFRGEKVVSERKKARAA